MKVKMLLVAAAIMLFASMSFGQDTYQVVVWGYAPVNNYCSPDGHPDFMPLADGTIGKVYWDRNHATLPGPDAADVIPNVEDPVVSQNAVNWVDAPINMGAGTFYFERYLISAWPTASERWYYVLWITAHDSVWTPSFTMANLGPNPDVEFYDAYNCREFVSCTSTPSWNWNYTGHAPQADLGIHNCATLCLNMNLTFSITVATGGGHADPVRVPVVNVISGCPVPVCGTETCVPAQFAPLGIPAVQVNANNIVYTYTIVPITEGCVCVRFDAILAATITNVAMLPGDNSVKVSWTSASETNLAKYQIVRDGSPIQDIAAEGGATAHNYSWTDASALNGTTYTYVIRTVNNDGTYNDQATASVTPSIEHAVITEYALHQNYPNPFNPTTSIRFDLVDRNFVTLKIYNATGQEVATVVNRECKAGVNVVNYDATNLTSGLYFYSVKIGNEYSATKKMLLLK